MTNAQCILNFRSMACPFALIFDWISSMKSKEFTVRWMARMGSIQFDDSNPASSCTLRCCRIAVSLEIENHEHNFKKGRIPVCSHTVRVKSSFWTNISSWHLVSLWVSDWLGINHRRNVTSNMFSARKHFSRKPSSIINSDVMGGGIWLLLHWGGSLPDTSVKLHTPVRCPVSIW